MATKRVTSHCPSCGNNVRGTPCAVQCHLTHCQEALSASAFDTEEAKWLEGYRAWQAYWASLDNEGKARELAMMAAYVAECEAERGARGGCDV